MARGAPLRFMGGVLAGWTTLRVAMLWPADLPAPLVAAPVLAETALAATSPSALPPSTTETLSVSEDSVAKQGGDVARQQVPPARTARARIALASASIPATPMGAEAAVQLASAMPDAKPDPGIARSPVLLTPDVARLASAWPPALVPNRPRLAGDGWLVLRPGGGDSLAFGQLGASQGGARLTYALDTDRRVALSARLSSPLRGSGREAAIGVDLRPTALPVHLLVEQRLGLDGGGARPAAGLVAGASTALPAGVRLDAYGQAGAVWGRGGFVDGAALVARPVLGRGATRVELGGGAWGAAQRRATRFDLGPSAALVAPVGGRTLRLQVDYRVRVTGSARPGSGPALTLGGSF